jgi:hypothetical protein
MRVTIQIDDQGQVTTPTEELVEGQLSLTKSSAPPADLAARAQALGAISAGAAPDHAPDPGTAGAPAITAPPEDEARFVAGDAAALDATSAGAAPGQPDPKETRSEAP